MLEARTKSRSEFDGIEAFYFRGKPRAVRIWDETCLPARALTLDVETIQELEKVATKADQGLLRNLLGQLVLDIRGHVGHVITLPDLRSGTNLDDDTLNSIYSGQAQDLRDAIFDLALLSGRTAAVVRDGKNRTIVHYANTLPDDLKPMVITDASGRVRQTYHYWSDGRGDLVRLRQGDKSYSNVHLHVWERAGSKSAWRTDHVELISCIASAIGGKANDEKWLVVYPQLADHFDHKRKQWTAIDIPTLLRERVPNPERLSFVYWGGSEFRATNEFRDIRNVMLAGTHFMPEPAYQALARLSLGLPAEERVKPEISRRIKQGEHANYILQAVCRAAVRQSIGADCGHCSVYVIAAKGSGIPEMLKSGAIFPKATVRTWMPVAAKAGSKVRVALDLIEREFKDPTMTGLPTSWIANEMNMDRNNFNKRVLQDPLFLNGLAQLGLEYVSQRRGGFIQRATTMEYDKEYIELLAKYPSEVISL
jgi:hypothetical protein